MSKLHRTASRQILQATDKRTSSEEEKLKEEVDEEDEEEDVIEWSNIIFLPFYFWWELLMLMIVCMKCIYAPFSALYPSTVCKTDLYSFVGHIKFLYTYVGDTLYVIDVALHIVHRQVSDVAKKKEYLPKSTCLILFDILSLIPFYNLVAGHYCETTIELVNIWPNILMFSELICAYRVAQFFLSSTHSFFKLITGFLIMIIIMINATTCLFLLMTYSGLCENCSTGVYDWRGYELSQIKYGDINNTFHVYLFAFSMVTARYVNFNSIEVVPHTYIEFICELVSLVSLYFIRILIVYPKVFLECVYRLKRIFSFHPRVKRIIAETKRRDPYSGADLTVKKFYRLSWTKQHGINTMPETINDLPSTLRTNIYIDLTWPVFYHSPILRNTSPSYKRWLSDKMELHRKLPKERFFEGPHCYTDLHYLKSGIVQIISAEDSKAPMISVTSGTLFGDVSFFVPPKNRKVIVHCLTYCEIFTVSRAHIVKSLHKFPIDSRYIMKAARDKVTHGKDLFNLKRSKRGLDRSEDEGIAYIKRRWWIINETIQRWKLSSKQSKKKRKCDIPPEDEPYHCSKYIGQLVLCSIFKMRLHSVFTREKFPWILASHSNFAFCWNRFLLVVVFIALVVLPPFLTRQPIHNSLLFRYFLKVIDIIYTADVVISLITVKAGFEHETRLKKVMLERCYSKYFILDVFSMFWVEYFVSIFFTHKKYSIVARYCRLMKTYILFCYNNRYAKYWNKNYNLLKRILSRAALVYVCSYYIMPYVFYWYIRYTKGLTVAHTYGDNCLEGDTCVSVEEQNEELSKFGFLALALGYWFTDLVPASLPARDKSEIYDFVLIAMIDIFYELFLFLFLNGMCTATFYLYYENRVKYRVLATLIRKYYKHIKIHPYLMKSLERYLEFHWKYYNGGDILYLKLLENEPYEIAWKLYYGVAEKVIRESKAFRGADPKLVTELAQKTKFMMYPKDSLIVMFGITVEDVSWLGSGVLMYEYHNENNEIVRKYVSNREMLSPCAIFFEHPSHKSCFAATDCEIIFINRKDFFETIRKYPDDSSVFQTVVEELHFSFQENASKMFVNESFKNKMRGLSLEARFTITSFRRPNSTANKFTPIIEYFKEFRKDPESRFNLHWRAFRAFIVFLSIVATALQCAGNATIYKYLEKLKLFCDLCSILDIFLKFTMPYYDQRGIVISNITKCTKHYLRRGFLMDVFGVILAHISLLKLFMTTWTFNRFKKFEMLIKYCHIYLLTGFFDYCADVAWSRSTFITLIKWQLILILTALGLAVYLVNLCVEYRLDANGDFLKMCYQRELCWLSKTLYIDKDNPTLEQLSLLFMAALEYVETIYANEFIGIFEEFGSKSVVAILSLFSSVVYRGFFYCCLALLIILYQTNTAYQYKINQLHNFLRAERVDKPLIEKTISYFMYNLKRTQGANVALLLNERVGTAFKQDLTYYFHKKTFRAADTLLGGGKTLERQLACSSKIIYFLPGEDIIREMDLSDYVYFVHRGKLVVLKEGKELATLTKGSIFGLLDGDTPRAARSTVHSVEHADVLRVSVTQFQYFINDTVRKNITDNFQSKEDYLAVKNLITEGPYNSIKYILRGIKTIKLPHMKDPVTPETSKYYEWWLVVVWVLNPVFNNIISFATFSIRKEAKRLFFVKVIIYVFLLPGCDLLHTLFMVSEFFTMETVVEGNECVQKYTTWKQFKNWERYLDLASLASSLAAYITWKSRYGWARVFRIYYIYKYCVEMSKTSKLQTKSKPMLLISMVVLFLITLVTCIWKYFACYRGDTIAPLFPEGFKFDRKEWKHPLTRINSCKVIRGLNNETDEIIFAIAVDWRMDYIISLLYGMVIFIGFDDNFAMPLNLSQITAKVLLWYFLKLVSICLISVAINAVNTKNLRKYQFDYQMSTLIKYMKSNGISKFLQELAGNYAKRFWQRTEDNWVPEITHEAPLCLREDIFEALYMHHLQRPILFHKLPHYILRQLVVRLQRTVIFPGQWIVKQGDAVSVIYFIHEGEVEKWHTDARGNTRMLTVLPSNNYFGLIPGLFPNTNFAYSYFSRTIVNCVYLEYDKWIDVLNYYPKLKQEFYIEAKNIKLYSRR